MAGRSKSTPRNDSARELREARAQQAATAAILRTIGRSKADPQPVFDEIVRHCSRLFGKCWVSLRLVRGEQLEHKASIGESSRLPVPINRRSVIGTCVLQRRLIHVPDLSRAV